MFQGSTQGRGLDFAACVVGTFAGIALLALAAAFAAFLPPVTYYFLPALTAAVLCVVAVSLHLTIGQMGFRAGVVEAAVILLPVVAYGLAIALLTQDVLLSRWLSQTVFQIHDAADFLRESTDLLLRGQFETVRGRPITVLLYSGLLDLQHFDVRGALWVTTAMAAAAGMAMAGVIGRLMGSAAAALAGYIMFDCMHDHVGGLSSEIPGYIFGTIGAAMLLHAAARGARAWFLAGFAILCVAMATRVGAVFVLPALLAWSYWYLPPLLGRRWWMAVAGLLLGAALFLGNQWLARIAIPTSGGSFANTAELWYGTIVEGQALLGTRKEADLVPTTRWVQIYADHPELRGMPQAQQADAKLKILIDMAKRYPLEAAYAGSHEIWGYVFDLKSFRFIEYKPLRNVIALMAYSSAWLCFVAMRRKRDPIAAMLFYCVIALVLSQPFLFGGESRVAVPTVGILAALVGYGIRTQFSFLRARLEALRRPDLRRLIARIPRLPQTATRDGSAFVWAAGALFATAFAIAGWGVLSRGTWRAEIANANINCAPYEAVEIVANAGAIVPGALWRNLTADALQARWSRLEAFFAARHSARSIADSDTKSEEPHLSLLLQGLREGRAAAGYAVDLTNRSLITAAFSEFRPGRSIACYNRGANVLSYPSAR